MVLCRKEAVRTKGIWKYLLAAAVVIAAALGLFFGSRTTEKQYTRADTVNDIGVILEEKPEGLYVLAVRENSLA